MSNARAHLAFVAVAWCALAIGFAFVIPPGEAPDEPAHLEYVDHILDHRELPPPPEQFDQLNYEAHQPPLDYAVTAAIANVVAPSAGDIAFERNPGFSFEEPGSRAFSVREGAATKQLHRLRAIRLFWGLLLLGAITAVCGLSIASVAAASLFLFAPQFLFTAATVNNDLSLSAASAWVVAASFRATRSDQWRWPAFAAIAFAVALFSKGSALFLLAPLAMAAAHFFQKRRFAAAAVLVVGTLAALAAWIALNVARFGAAIPPVPDVDSRGWGTLLTEPLWIASLWQSFWAKLGWLNTPLPLPLYLWFTLPTALVCVGLWKLRRERTTALLVVATLAGNLFLVLAYMTTVDWQPQGRYLFPSVAALAFCASTALEGFHRRFSTLSIAGSLTVAGFAVVYLGRLF